MPIYNSINLINPPVSNRYVRGWRDGYNPPLGLMALKSCLAAKLPAVNSALFDMEFDRTLDTADVIHADLVALSPTAFSYEQAVCIATEAKARGCDVIIGGVHASHLADTILRNRPEVDYVCRSSGEEALCDLMSGRPLEQIANLVYRVDGKIVGNAVRHPPMGAHLDLDRSQINIDAYLQRFSKFLEDKYDGLPYKRPMAIFSQRGCRWRVATGGCLFCSRADNFFALREPADVWKEVALLVDVYGADLIWDFSDSVLSDRDWFCQFAASKPQTLNPLFYVYGRADEITPECVEKLKSINAYQLLVGIETGDAGLKLHKGTSIAQDIKAAELLHANGIKLFPSFCLGMPGENADSLRRTLDYARELCQRFKPDEIAASILIPFPGSPAFRKMMHEFPRTKARFAGYDMILPEELQEAWVANYCDPHLDFGTFIRVVQEILQLAPLKSTFAAPVVAKRLPFMDEAARAQLVYDERYREH